VNNPNSVFVLLSNPLHLIWYPGCEEVDSTEEMVSRMQATQDLLDGKLQGDVYLDLLDAQGFDVYQLLDDWEEACFQ